jgi:hypothetical protein
MCSPLDGATAEKSASRRLLDERRSLVMELMEREGMFPTSELDLFEFLTIAFVQTTPWLCSKHYTRACSTQNRHCK